MIQARLIKLTEMEADDFAMSAAQFEVLKTYENEVVLIDETATHGYFDITTRDGTKYAAISAYHLKYLPRQ